ncbi:MAG: AlpA family transcriptional regulator [Pseudomonadota bacterium]
MRSTAREYPSATGDSRNNERPPKHYSEASSIDPILRRPDVERLTGLARSTIYARMAEGTFPKPIKLGGSAVGWRQSAIAEWLEALGEAA